MSDTKKIFGERLRKLRVGRGMEVKDLSFKLSLAPTTIYGYENGSRGPDMDTLRLIADFFNVTTDYLVGRSKHQKLTELQDVELDNETRILIETVESLPEDLRKQFMNNAVLMKKHLENK